MHNQNSSRRNFVKLAALAGVATIGNPAAVFAKTNNEVNGKVKLEKGSIILFQGDSITDAGRDYNNKQPNNTGGMGSGYAYLAAAQLLLAHANKNLTIYNRGIAGNKVYSLLDRWQADCLDIKPDILSIYIGVNDYWATVSFGYKATSKTYKDDYKKLLDQTKQKLPNVKLIIGEPFGVLGVEHVVASWYPAFNEFREAAKDLAATYGATFIPNQQIFDTAQKKAPGIYWTEDGVHPTIAGSQLMANAWLKAIK